MTGPEWDWEDAATSGDSVGDEEMAREATDDYEADWWGKDR